ncbi:HEAT repeat domain-containing protein [Bacillus sp. 03113]|uniref:HEAT repeat domain-containing protein n=1 Tax=Bacillus sp. 03113 TaxID=2578211 RepID=UPI00215CC4A5|nr:HEAT repeat domain-containing protein [Bacillus sp. 03113]
MNNFQKQVRLEKEKMKEEFFAYFFGQLEELSNHSQNKVQRMAQEELLLNLTSIVDDEGISHNIQGFAEENWMNKYRKDLKHSRWSVRMNALYAIENFKMRNLADTLIDMYENRKLTLAEESQILKILVQLAHPQFVHYMTQPIHPISEFMYRSLLGYMTEEQFQSFIDKFQELPEIVQLALIDIIGIKSKVSCVPFLKQHLQDDSTEIRIRVLKALVELSYPISIEELTAHIQSAMWQERMMAAKLLGKSKKKESLSYLEQLMHDSQFLVRSNAAQSMLMIDGGRDFLKTVLDSTTDRYVKDMANDWLERGGITVVE